MKIAIGSDHRGFPMKDKLVGRLSQLGHDVIDVGTTSDQSVDYTDFAAETGRRVSNGEADRGILVCGTGIGMCITANKFPDVRAATCHDEITAEKCRQHNNVNVLCLSGDALEQPQANKIVDIWLTTEFEGGRHARRVNKIAEIERTQNC